MRIVTRPDFDGIACAVVISDAEEITEPTRWLEPGEIQNGSVDIKENDIMANLPFDDRCRLWFDHHVSNPPGKDFSGAFKIAPSAAGVVYEYYKDKNRLSGNFDELVYHTDIIDSARFTKDQVVHPEQYPYIILSMTVKNNHVSDADYWERLVSLLSRKDIDTVLADDDVSRRIAQATEENALYEDLLKKYTKIERNVSITDFRSVETPLIYSGNKFLSYYLFPEIIASIKINYNQRDTSKVMVGIGKSIFNDKLRVNIGRLLLKFGGGGHAGAGGCTLDADTADDKIARIIKTIQENREI